MNELKLLSQAITATFQAGVPDFATVEAFSAVNEHTPQPALCHTITAMEATVDPGDGRLCILARFEARILVDAQQQHAALQAATLAAKSTLVLHKQFWGVDFVAATLNVKAQTAIPAEVPGTLEWRVQWQQPVYLGDLQWPWPDQPPGSLLFAFSPDTGPAHKDSYQAPEDMA
nr:hypothetical protein [uncultured Pseudomonas sp.]